MLTAVGSVRVLLLVVNSAPDMAIPLITALLDHAVPAAYGARIACFVVRARDRNPNGPRPALAGLGSAGPGDRQPFRVISVPRGLEPGRGPLGPRGAMAVILRRNRRAQR